MVLQWISRQQAELAGSCEKCVLLEQTPGHYAEFQDFLTKEFESASGDLYFAGSSGLVYRVGRTLRSGVEICVRFETGSEPPTEQEVDTDLWEFLRWLVEQVGGEWSVTAPLQTRKLSEMPRSIYKLFPFIGQFLKVQGQYMHYVDAGAGQPVVMLHGNPTWSFLYREIIPEVSEVARAIA